MNRKLSTLEMTVLGLSWLRGPSTTYALMKELSLSVSSYHKSRAGAAYSVTSRLIAAGFLEHEHSGSKNVRITESGEEALRAWLKPPISSSDIAHSADLVRLRFFFLGAIPLPDRLAFIDQVSDELESLLETSKQMLPANEEIGDHFGVLATLSMVLETRARIEWLRIVRRWVEAPPAEGESWSDVVLRSAGL